MPDFPTPLTIGSEVRKMQKFSKIADTATLCHMAKLTALSNRNENGVGHEQSTIYSLLNILTSFLSSAQVQ